MRVRATYHIGFDHRTLKQADIELNAVKACLEEMPKNRIANYPADEVGSLAGVDHWMAQGFNGLTGHFEDRLDVPEKVADGTLEQLITERDRLNKLISKIQEKNR